MIFVFWYIIYYRRIILYTMFCVFYNVRLIGYIN
uniref:YoaP-like protein n=1 Tax=Siphoviridae sp. ctTBR23 TaxID=2825515 RepID=A0A8S5P0J8_9CAUD|nr:MAG TPA: YoaP-like protein [Siphoviridae sp. ctTBR23]